MQAYVRDIKSSVSRPDKELKAFKKVEIAPGETDEVNLELDKSSFAFYNPDTRMWTVEPGKFEILIGTSSGNISTRLPLEIKNTMTWSDSDR